MAGTTKVLGKIDSARFGYGGYQEVMFGLDLGFTHDECLHVGSFIGFWSPSTTKRTEYAKWSEQERRDEILRAALKLDETLHLAKKRHVGELVGVPVELEFEGEGLLGSRLKSWRVLTEVL